MNKKQDISHLLAFIKTCNITVIFITSVTTIYKYRKKILWKHNSSYHINIEIWGNLPVDQRINTLAVVEIRVNKNPSSTVITRSNFDHWLPTTRETISHPLFTTFFISNFWAEWDKLYFLFLFNMYGAVSLYTFPLSKFSFEVVFHWRKAEKPTGPFCHVR